MKQNALKKSVCIFDFDGTLVDSMGSFADLAADLMKEAYAVGWEQARQDYLHTSGLPFSQQLEELYPEHVLNSQVAQSFEDKKIKSCFASPFFKEVPHILEKLQVKGVRTVISSNNGQEVVEAYLDQQEARVHFDMVLGYQEGFAKGRPHFEKIMKHFEVVADHAVFVGDSLHDAQKAENFGLDFVGRLGTFTREKFQQDYPQAHLVDDFSQLTEVVCK